MGHNYQLRGTSYRPPVLTRVCSRVITCLPAFGGAGGRRRLVEAGALRGRLFVALATSKLAISFEGDIRNFPCVSRYVLVACLFLYQAQGGRQEREGPPYTQSEGGSVDLMGAITDGYSLRPILQHRRLNIAVLSTKLLLKNQDK